MPDASPTFDREALSSQLRSDCDPQAAIAFLEHASDILSDNYRRDVFCRQQGNVAPGDEKMHQIRFSPAIAFLYEQLKCAHLCSASEALHGAPDTGPGSPTKETIDVVVDSVSATISTANQPLSDRIELAMLFIEAHARDLAVNSEHLDTLRRMKPDRTAKPTEQKANNGHPA